MSKTPSQRAVKPAAKPVRAPAAPKQPAAPKTAPEPSYAMSREVKEWIERAQSIMNHQRGEIERLKAENSELKSYKKWAEHRILRSDHE